MNNGWKNDIQNAINNPTPKTPESPSSGSPAPTSGNWVQDIQSAINGTGPSATYPDKPNNKLDQVNAMPNSEKLSPLEKWTYQQLPGFSQSSVGKALEWFGKSPAGKVLGYLDVAAEGLERTLGLLAQYRDKQPGDEFKLKDAWAAGSIFWDVSKLPRVQYDANGKMVGIRIDDTMPGAYAVTEARKQLEQGKTLDEVKNLMYSNMGALALRSQLQDTLGHIAGDPFTWALGVVKPIESLHAIRSLALSGKMDVGIVKAMEAEARVAGDLETATKLAEAITKAESQGKAMNRIDKFAIAFTGGTPWLNDTSKMSKGEQLLQKISTSRLNPLALTPQARASEVLDMVAANVGEHLITPNLYKDPEEFLKTLSSAARGAIGGEWGHLAMTTEGRTVQGILSNSDAAMKGLSLEWKTYEGERNLLGKLMEIMPGETEHSLWKLAGESPELLMQKITKAAMQPGGELIAKELQEGRLTQQVMENIGKIGENIPLFKEKFYVQALVRIQDVAMQQSIVQFGIKEKGLLTKWSDALKAWETIPFIKANPANAVRNVVNNDITLIGRGLFGTMTGDAIESFWKGKWVPPQFRRGFGLGGEATETADLAGKRLIDALTGKETLADKVKMAAGKVNLGKADFSQASATMESKASIRAATNGWLQFHQQYWNPKTGFTSISKTLDPKILDEMEQAIPGITRTLDEVAQSSGADTAKFAELMQSNIEHNVTTIFKNTEDGLGYKLEDVLGTETMHTIQEGLPQAIEKGNVREFVNGVRTQMEQHVDEMFNKHLENLPGIVQAQVQAGGPLQYHRIFGKAMDEFWGGNTEHAIRMSHINELIDSAKSVGDWKKVDGLWKKIMSDGESHFGRVWKKFDAYQEGLQKGAEAVGMKYPKEVSQAFGGMQSGWKEFFNFRNTELQKFFDAGLEGKAYSKGLNQIQGEIDKMYGEMVSKEDSLFQNIDDLMSGSLPDKSMQDIYKNFRDQASQLRVSDRQATQEFYKKVRTATSEEAPDMWSQYWSERSTRLEQMRQLELRGSSAIQGNSEAMNMFAGAQPTATGQPPANIMELANQYGIPSATTNGTRNNRRILNTVNKYLPEGQAKFKTIDEIPLEIAQQAFESRVAKTVENAGKASEHAFIPDAEKLFPDPMPIETGISELNYGRSYAAMDALSEEAVAQSSKKSALLKDLSPEIQDKVGQWAEQVNGEMSSFRSAGVQFSAFRRDSALLNYNRRTNFDNFVGHMAPFAFWTTHSVANWAIHSLDRPAMLTSYFRARKLFETAGLKDQNIPSRMRDSIKVKMPFTPDWMGDTYVNPMKFMLPFDSWMQPWEQAQQSKLTTDGKAKETLSQMMEQGKITEDEYNKAIQSKTGDAWDKAVAKAQEGGDNYDAMDFVSMTMTPHAPLMWAYNAARGQKSEIGPFTPLSKTTKNVATMLGVDDWSNSPYNVEGRLRKSMGLEAFDKWDDYRVGREISNMAADGKFDMEKVKEAMQVAAMVEAGKMSSADAVQNNEVYAEATKRANQESAGGWAGTVLGLFGIPLKAYPTGEEKQRALGEEFSAAVQEKNNGQPDALAKFFDKHPEYESRLALFKSPEDRLKSFMVDNIWAKWNDLPKVNQDELKAQLGDNFANNFVNKETRNYDSLSPTQLSVYLKLMGGKPVGTLTADQEVMVELNQIKLTAPETAWRVQTFYDMRNQEHKDWYTLQNKYYGLPEKERPKFLQGNPELKQYWSDRKDWMNKNPDLVRFLTDDPKQLKQYENKRRNPSVAVPTADEIRQQLSQPTQELIADWGNGQSLPPSIESYLGQFAQQNGMTMRDMLGILTGK